MVREMRRFPALLALLLAAAALPGCGGGGAGAADTAMVVPKNAFFYGEAVIDPDGEQEQAARAIIARFPGEGPPEQRLEKAIAKGLRESDEGKLDYEKDVKPWLGDTIGFFGGAPAGNANAQGGYSEGLGAVVVATEDEDAALEAIQKSGGKDLTKKTYKDVEYFRDPDEDGELNAGGIIEGFAVVGTEAAFKAAVDASKGESLAESERYKKALDSAEDERIGFIYYDVQGVINVLARQQGAGAQVALLGGTFRQLFGDQPIIATAKAENDGVVVDSALPAEGGSLFSFFGKGTDLIGELPAGSWAAFGQPELGKSISQLVESFAGFAGGKERIKAEVQRQTGLDLDRDILGWIGDVAFFVEGTDMESIGGGAVIASTDQAASRRALAGLRRLIEREGGVPVRAVEGGFAVMDPETPKGVFFVQKGERVAIAYGRDAADSAFGASGRLSGDARFKTAQQKLGDGYKASMFVAMDSILELARNFGADEAELQKAEPYLKAFDHIAGGTKTEGKKLLSRTRIGLK